MGADRLTAREAQVLTAIGRRLSNPEIAAELVLSVRTVESHVAALRRKLGVDTRAGLVAAGLAREAAIVSRPVGSLVGGDVELARVAEHLAPHRLVTITGSGGCGKARLALEVAVGWPDRVVVVELGRVDRVGVEDAELDVAAPLLDQALAAAVAEDRARRP